ncbi:esterase-like activity of phytase family protein [Alkalihalobacillus sp. TS-13]|uniref:esterase-like activity of phytase family protein n=1 Tax=Alkalihalobacillus sp. TS-13 TaxID=2842455 RepID=UPI001C872F44|nr:esterase-like activity of phytase family protein [Alkalihalobacillus sp. TS-13]
MRSVRWLSISIIAVLLLVYSFQSVLADENRNQPKSEEEANQHQEWMVNKEDRPPVHSVDHLKLIGSKIVPNNAKFRRTSLGGFSGLSYDPRKHQWYIISDDRSMINPARYYTGKLRYNERGFKSVRFTDVTFLKQPDGTLYPSKEQYNPDMEGDVPDFESIRYDTRNGGVWYTSEGDRSLDMNPLIRHATLNGTYQSGLPISENVKMDKQSAKGFRNNLSLEGSTFSPDGLSYWTVMEGPLFQDGSVPTVDTGAVSRITRYDRDGNVKAQYAYNIDPIPAEPGPGKHADNGVTDILSINDHEFLILERSGVQSVDGSFKNYIRIYKINTENATDIKDMDTIKNRDFVPVRKQLVLNMNELGLSNLDNIEGMSWGKRLKNGHDSLVLVSDNNFNDSQVTQFIALEVFPE